MSMKTRVVLSLPFLSQWPLSGLYHLSASEPDGCYAHTKREDTALSFPQTTIRAANVVNRQLAGTNDP